MLRTATGRDVSLSGGNFSGKKTSRRFSFEDSKSDPSAFKPKLGALAGTRLRTGEVSVGAINIWFAIKKLLFDPSSLFRSSRLGVAAYLLPMNSSVLMLLAQQ